MGPSLTGSLEDLPPEPAAGLAVRHKQSTCVCACVCGGGGGGQTGQLGGVVCGVGGGAGWLVGRSRGRRGGRPGGRGAALYLPLPSSSPLFTLSRPPDLPALRPLPALTCARTAPARSLPRITRILGVLGFRV